MKKPIFIFCIFVFSIITNIFAGNPNDTTYVKTEYYEGIIFGKNYSYNSECVGSDSVDKIRWTPTMDDVTAAEKVLKKYVQKYSKKRKLLGLSFIDKKLDNYFRQYNGVFRNGRKILCINGVLIEKPKRYHDCNVSKVYVFDNEDEYCYYIFDAGEEYWFISIDMDKKESIDFYGVNHTINDENNGANNGSVP